MAKNKTTQPEIEEQPKDFTEIGGSPVPGLTLRHVLRGHTNKILRLAWSPDGSYLASPSVDRSIRVWDVNAENCKDILQGHEKTVISVAWSPDGQYLASASMDKTIRIWDIAKSKYLQTLNGHGDTVYSAMWSPSGKQFASASFDGTIRLWDITQNKQLHVFERHTDHIISIAWSPDGQYLASASTDNTICLWDTVDRKELQKMVGHTKSTYGVAWSPSGLHLASASTDGTIRLWNTNNGKALQVLEGHSGGVGSIAFSSNNDWLASKGSDTVKLWHCNTWNCVVTISESVNSNWTVGIAFHPHLPILATLGENDTIIRIWELDEAVLLGQAKENVNYTTAKLVLVGDSGVGKTGLGWRMAHGEFKEHASTHGQQFWSIPELGLKRQDGTDCEAVLWDLAGQHVYRQVHSIFLENVAAALVLFDPSNRQDPLKGAQFWLEQLKEKGKLPPTVLVGARVDRGAPALSQADLDQFCQRYGITGGYLSTSALSGEGLDALLEKLKAQIPWEEMTATITTVTFKRIKDYVLSLKEKTDRKGVLVSPQELRA